jgi:hypothetical protein
MFNVDHGGGRVCADLDTRSDEGYASGGEVLPGERSVARQVAGVAAGAGRSSACPVVSDGFAVTRERFEALLGWAGSEEAGALEHSEFEERLASDGREVLRCLFQDSLDLCAVREPRLDAVVGSDGVRRPNVERAHERPLATVVGEVRVSRIAYRARGHENLYVADGALNLPEEKPSHGIRRLAALEAPRGSFEDAQEAIVRYTGERLGKRQLRELVVRSAVDFESFYEQRQQAVPEEQDVLVLTCDAKGVVMRPEALREQTKKQAQDAKQKLQTRLSKGEKRGRKRMAEVVAVYEVTPGQRTGADILPATDQERQAARQGPEAKNKWLTASVTDDAAIVITQMFDEAQRRDPEHKRSWVALVDGNNHQIDRIKKEARKRKVNVTILVDCVHVMEYLWDAAWCFFEEGDPAAERWVHEKARAVMDGRASTVAAAIRRKATCLELEKAKRKNADVCADYLLAKHPYLDYPTALTNGWPIATGVIEGACRHLIKDRMDITGARWGLDSAEAVLKLRALHSNGDFEAYWRYHRKQERRRIHESRYPHGVIPRQD